MCGIVGYTGHRQACKVLIQGLSRLEYRGYDSAGIVVNKSGQFWVAKKEGRLNNLSQYLKTSPIEGTCGIGHTRWATHGIPSDRNSHPHGTSKIMLVHNGIIENFQKLKDKLTKKGYSFLSETDSEIAACLIDDCYHGDPVLAIRQALEQIEGSYAFVIMFSDFLNTIYAVRKDGPLVVAPGDNENFVGSDVLAFIDYTKDFFTLDVGELAVISPSDIVVYSEDGSIVEKKLTHVDWSIENAQREGFERFMLKEIHEQPVALSNTIHPRIKDELPNFDIDGIPSDFFSRYSRLWIVACGTAMHAGLVGRLVIEKLARMETIVEVASEFRYQDPILKENDLVIIISQSGETADSLAALRLAKSKGITTLAIVNVVGSSVSREADYVIYTYAGPEISVASTKAYIVQISVLYLLAFSFALAKGKLIASAVIELTKKLLDVRHSVNNVINNHKQLLAAADIFARSEHLFFLGRGLDWALACEGSLKLKEISYIHCEAYAAGELKHGTISLITDGTPVLALSTQDATAAKMHSNIQEVEARGANVVLITKATGSANKNFERLVFELDALDDLFMPFPAVTALQLLAYHTAHLRGCDIDKPRNLAKSVTVE
jgi:glucosamine--fructose-6-phosphate aminotransferase (isomerizing)